MDRVAVFVDAGYLYATGGQSLTGLKTPRKKLTLDVKRVVPYLEAMSEVISGMPMLRIYWYDASRTSEPEDHQRELNSTPNIKLRLGRVNDGWPVERRDKPVDNHRPEGLRCG